MQFLSAILLSAPVFGLASAAVARRDPNPQVCGARSQELTAVQLADFDYSYDYLYSTPAHQNSVGTIRFLVKNPALDYTVSCVAYSDRVNTFFYGDQAYNCTAPTDQPADQAAQTSFTFDVDTGVVSIKQSWPCLDVPQHQAKFVAQGSTQANLTCHETKNFKNPDWKLGEIYSEQAYQCDIVTLSVPVTVETFNIA